MYRIYLTLFLIVQGCTFGLDIAGVIPEFETFVASGMKASHVPGVVIAIVHEGETVFIKGFGFRDVDKELAVTPDTVFQLASVSKPLTSTILGSLVSKGKIKWDSKISDLDPSFRLSSSFVTAELTIKDLLSHRSGLPGHAGDILEDLGYGKQRILHQLRFITPLGSFREQYAYTNMGFSEAAFAASKELNTSWESLASEALYKPLGLTATSSSFADYINSSNKALTYVIRDGGSELLDHPRMADAQSPAGGFHSTAADLAKWMVLQLGGFEDKEIIDPKVLLETQTPVILTGVNQTTGQPSFYGLGWSISFNDKGQRVVQHSGAFSLGVRTQVSLIPELKLGIVVLANASPSALPEAISQGFFDLLFKGKVDADLVSNYNQKWFKFQVEPELKFTVDKASFTPSLALKSYVGRYQNDYYGEIEIKEVSRGLELVIGPEEKVFPLSHLTRDVFSFVTRGENATGETQVIFSVDESNQVRHLTIDYLNRFGMGTFLTQE